MFHSLVLHYDLINTFIIPTIYVGRCSDFRPNEDIVLNLENIRKKTFIAYILRTECLIAKDI